MQDNFALPRTRSKAAARPSARATIGYIIYNDSCCLYTRYPIVARRAWPVGCSAFRPSASREQRYLAYNHVTCRISRALDQTHVTIIIKYIYIAGVSTLKVIVGNEHRTEMSII